MQWVDMHCRLGEAVVPVLKRWLGLCSCEGGMEGSYTGGQWGEGLSPGPVSSMSLVVVYNNHHSLVPELPNRLDARLHIQPSTSSCFSFSLPLGNNHL